MSMVLTRRFGPAPSHSGIGRALVTALTVGALDFADLGFEVPPGKDRAIDETRRDRRRASPA